MKTVNFRRILFFAFLTLVFTGGLFFSKGSTWAAECPIHTIDLSYDSYTPNNIEEVKELQKILSEDKEVWDDNYEINGIFNGATVIALYKFQVKYELPAKEDDTKAGVIDVETRDKLCEFWSNINAANLQVENEDPVSGTLSASASSVQLGQAVILTLTAQDDQGVDKVFTYYQNDWHSQNCAGATTCTKTFSIKETKAGTYSYYGYVVGKKLNGTTEDFWTTPHSRLVKVFSSRIITGSRNQVEPNTQDNNVYKEGSIVGFGQINLGSISTLEKAMPISTQPIHNSGIPDLNAGGFTFNNPSVDVTKKNDGTYTLKWFTTNTPAGLLNLTVVDDKGNQVYEGTSYLARSGVWWGEFDLGKLDPDKKYTFTISNGGQEGSYTFDGDALKNGAEIIHRTIVNQFYGKGNYIYSVSSAVSSDQTNIHLDLQISGVMGPAKTKDFKTLLIKDSSGKVLKTLSGDWNTWGPILAGQKVSLDLDLTKINGPIFIQLFSNDGTLIEEKRIDIMSGEGTKTYTTFQSAKGWGSVYNPKITYSSQGTATQSVIKLSWQAAGSGKIEVVDAATGNVVKLASISGVSLSNLPKGSSYYINFYDLSGKLAHTEALMRSSSGKYETHEVKVPQLAYYQDCGGGSGSFYIGGVGKDSTSQLKEVKINGESVSLSGAGFQIEASKLQNGDTVSIKYQDSKTGAEFIINYTIGANHQIVPGAIINTKGANVPLIQKVSSANSNSGITITGYSDGMNPSYAIISGFEDLTLTSMYFGYTPHDTNQLYQQNILEEFKKTGILPRGDYMFKDQDGNILRIYVSGDGGTRVLYDRTEVTELSEEIQDDLSDFFGETWTNTMTQVEYALNQNNGKHSSGYSYTSGSGLRYIISVNPTADTVTIKTGTTTKIFSSIDEVEKFINGLREEEKTPSEEETPVIPEEGVSPYYNYMLPPFENEGVDLEPYSYGYTKTIGGKEVRVEVKGVHGDPIRNIVKVEIEGVSKMFNSIGEAEHFIDSLREEEKTPSEEETPVIPEEGGGGSFWQHILHKSSLPIEPQGFWRNFMAFILGLKNK